MIAAVLALFAGCRGKQNDVSMFRGDTKHSGRYVSKPINDPPKVKWKFYTRDAINSSGTIAAGKIYFGGGDNYIYCLNLESGKQIWKFKTGGAVHSTPAVSNGIVYAGSYDAFFYALDAETGEIKWKFKTDGEKAFSAPGLHGGLPKDSIRVDDWDFYLSSPAVAEGTVYFGAGSGYLYALDAVAGTQRWKFKTGDVVHSSPAIAYGNVYVGSWDTYMYALKTSDGAEVWKFKTGIDTAIYNQTGIQGSPMIADSVLYFGCRDSHLYALNAVTGSKLWQKFNDYSWAMTTPVIYNEMLIYGTADGHSLVGLNKATGDSIYGVPAKGYLHSSPSLVDDRVYFGDLNGFIMCADARTGKTVWRYQLDASKQDRYKILAADSTWDFQGGFSRDNRKKLKMTFLQLAFTLGSVVSSPAVKDGVIYFGSVDGNFYALQ